MTMLHDLLRHQEWADAEGLLALVDDSDFGVRKSAMYRLGLLPPSARIAQ